MSRNTLRLLALGLIALQPLLAQSAHAVVGFNLATSTAYGSGYSGGYDTDPNTIPWYEQHTAATSTTPLSSLVDFGNVFVDNSSNSVTYSTTVIGGLEPGYSDLIAQMSGNIAVHTDPFDPGSSGTVYQSGGAGILLDVVTKVEVGFEALVGAAFNDIAGTYDLYLGVYDLAWNPIDTISALDIGDATSLYSHTAQLTAGSYYLDYWAEVNSANNNWSGADLSIGYSISLHYIPEPSADLALLLLGATLPGAWRRRHRQG